MTAATLLKCEYRQLTPSVPGVSVGSGLFPELLLLPCPQGGSHGDVPRADLQIDGFVTHPSPLCPPMALEAETQSKEGLWLVPSCLSNSAFHKKVPLTVWLNK